MATILHYLHFTLSDFSLEAICVGDLKNLVVAAPYHQRRLLHKWNLENGSSITAKSGECYAMNCLCMYVCMHVYVFSSMYECVCVFCTYMYVCMYVFIYVYTYIHTYIHTYLLRNAESAALHKANTAVVPAVCEAMQAADVHGIESCQALVVVGDVVGEHPKRFAFQYRHSKPSGGF